MNSFVSGIIDGITIEKSSIYKSVYFYGSSDNCSYAVDKATQAYATQNPEKKIVRITGDGFTEKMISSIKNGTSDRFKSEMANADFLIMEQIDSIAGKEASMQLFYGIFDKVYESGRQIIVTGSVPPKDIPALANRIRTQLEGGIMCRLEKETV